MQHDETDDTVQAALPSPAEVLSSLLLCVALFAIANADVFMR